MGCEERPSVFPPARRPAPSDGLQLPDVSHRAADVRSRRSPAESRGRFLRSPSEEERWEKAGEASGRFGTPASPLEGRSLFPPFPQPFRPPSRRSRRRFRICASAWDSSSTVSVCVTPIMRADLLRLQSAVALCDHKAGHSRGSADKRLIQSLQMPDSRPPAEPPRPPLTRILEDAVVGSRLSASLSSNLPITSN